MSPRGIRPAAQKACLEIYRDEHAAETHGVQLEEYRDLRPIPWVSEDGIALFF